MDFAEIPVAVKAVVVIVGAVIAWFVLLVAIMLNIRVFTLGCAAVAVLLVLGGIVTWLS